MRLTCIFLLLGVISCSGDKLPKYVELNDLRILALVTNTPEVAPGATVTITPLVSDITATGLTFTAYACLDLGVAYGAEPNCDNNGSRQSLAINQAVTTLNTAKHWTGSADAFNVTVPASAVIFSGKSSVEQFNGVAYLVDYSLTNNLGKTVRAIKRIIVSNKTAGQKNQAPVIADVQMNGVNLSASQALSSLPNSEVSLAATFTAGAESYSQQNSDGSLATKTETLTTTWFITDGRVKFYRTLNSEENRYFGPETLPTSRDAFVIAVVRDGRGGEGFRRLCFGACP